MQSWPRLDGHLIKTLLLASLEFILLALVFLVIRKIALSVLYRWARKTGTKADDIVLDSIKTPTIYWAVSLALYIALDTSNFSLRYTVWGLSALYVLIIFSITIAAANIGSRLFENAIEKYSINIPSTGLSRTVIKGVIFAIGLLVILNSLGISITPMLTALGVGGLAVALALQDTLSNLFAGIHILAERPVKVGDYIKLNTGEEGFITDIGWRSTRIEDHGHNRIIVPNNKLAQSVITNFTKPERTLALSLKIGVSYDTDPDRMEKILIEEALSAAPSVKGLLTEPPPVVRFIPGFGEYTLDFTLICQMAEHADQGFAQHELRKRILKRLKAEGIEIPFLVKTLNIKK